MYLCAQMSNLSPLLQSSHSPYNIRVWDWLKKQEYHDLPPPLVEIVLAYSYTETLFVVGGFSRECPSTPPFFSFCPGLDQNWVRWEHPNIRPNYPLSVAVKTDHSILLAAGLFHDLGIFFHPSGEHANQWRVSNCNEIKNLLERIRSMVILKERTYLLGTKITPYTEPCLVSLEEAKILKEPPTLLEATLFAVPPGIGTSFDSKTDTTLSGVLYVSLSSFQPIVVCTHRWVW